MPSMNRYRLDELRRFATSLAAMAGLVPGRASAFVSQLLWYDAAGASTFGIDCLDGWLERIERGDVDPKAEGKVGLERAGTAIFDGKNGIPHLILERAAGLASEKARDVGVGLVRVSGIKGVGSAAAVAAEVAIGPLVGLVLGPDASVSLAIPSADGLPVVADSILSGRDGASAGLGGVLGPWSLLAGERDWLVLAATVPAIEPLASFLERVDLEAKSERNLPGLLRPGPWDAKRREVRELGVPVSAKAMKRMERWGERFGLTAPAKLAG
jgi:hypothetical protein